MSRRVAKKARVEAANDSDSEEGWNRSKALAAWDDNEEAEGAERDEGSSEDEAENQKERILSKGAVLNWAPLKRVMTRKLKNSQIVAYAVLTDLGGGVEGFLPLSEMAESDSARDVLSQKLTSIRDPAAPQPGMPDRRPKIHHVMPKGPGQQKTQVVLTARGEAICTAMQDGWGKLPSHVSKLLSHLYDRDRVAEATNMARLHIGLLLEGSVVHRSKDGVVAELTNPLAFRQRSLIGVAVGANAEMPADMAALPAGAVPGSPSSVPGTPQSVSSAYDVRRFRPTSLKCRVLDFDLETGYVDVACSPSVTQCGTALSSSAAHNTAKTLKKKVGKEIPLHVILKKKDYAVVISRQVAGAIGYMPFRNEAEAAKVKSGDKVTGITEYVHVKPPPKQAKRKGPNTPSGKHWTQVGRRMQDDDEEEPSTPRTPGTPGSTASSARTARSGGRVELPNFDEAPSAAWLCAEDFAVFSFVPPQPKVDLPAPDAVPASATATAISIPTAEVVASLSLADLAAAPPAEAAQATAQVKKAAPIEVGFDFREPEAAPLTQEEKERRKKEKKREKRKREEENELLVDEVERRKLTDAEPQTLDDFERLVMASPHSSFVWCQFMAFYVSQREFESARLVAERALKKIDYRETTELHNVWVAYLNLENLHGTPESLQAVFQRFAQHSDEPEKAYIALIQIGKATGHSVLVERTYQTMLKKFGHRSIKPWIDYAEYLLSKGSQDELQKLQKRILSNQSLAERQHIDFLIKLGCMQYRQGSIDKGRTLFEGLIIKYPKRTDIWSVYIDMEHVVLPRLDDLSRIRNIFDRITSMSLSSKKMQFFMTRYLSFEKQRGTPERVEYVKKRAMDFVNAKLGEAEET